MGPSETPSEESEDVMLETMESDRPNHSGVNSASASIRWTAASAIPECSTVRVKTQCLLGKRTLGDQTWQVELRTIACVNERMKEAAHETAQHEWVPALLVWDEVGILGKYVVLEDRSDGPSAPGKKLRGEEIHICLVISGKELKLCL